MRVGAGHVGMLVAAALLAAACTAPGLVGFPPAAGEPAVDTAEPDVAGPVSMEGRHLVDAHGRVVLVRGTNLVRKSPPYVPPAEAGWMSPVDLERLRADGHNGVRLGVWAARLMPEPGTVDDAYLDELAGAVEVLTDAGFWVLLDVHQDVFTGMPAWATTPAAAALSDEVPAFLAPIGWAAAYATDRSRRQWEDWWANAPIQLADGGSAGVQDLFAVGIAAVAERFDGHPNVIGIDLLNEPFAGEQFLGCATSCGGRYTQVAAMFTRLGDAARAADPDVLLWWEPFTIGEPFPGVADPGEGIGLSFHAYCIGTDGGQPVEPSAAEAGFCDALFSELFRANENVARRWDAPAMLTEFGASDSPLNAAAATRLADQHLLSWLHWHGPNLFPDVVRSHLVRTTAQAVAGEPTHQRFDPATGDFELRWAPDHSIDAPTSVVVPAQHYPHGYTAAVTGGVVTSAPDAGRVTVEPAPDAGTVVLRITRDAAG